MLKFRIVFRRIYSKARLISLISNIGKNVNCDATVEIKYSKNIQIGNNVTIGRYSCIGAKSNVKIGDYVRISRGVIIETAGLNLKVNPPYPHTAKPIFIEDGVWIATNSIILGGVTIGKNSIIGANTVVTKDIPPYSIVVGSSNRLFRDKLKIHEKNSSINE
jgi:acetyltransferase-like isoleucine patch superfamily enzyme